MKWTRCLVLGLAALLAWGGTAFSQQQPARPKKPRVLVTISKETTYLTEPLRADGYVDYLAAVNQRCQAGVTPENNAAVLYWKAMGPAEINAEHREQYCRTLGIEPLPETGDYFVTIAQFAQGLKDKDTDKPAGETGKEWFDILDGQRDLAQKRPWSQKDFPLLAGWLVANEKPLALIVEASKRPRRYDPLISKDGSLLGALCFPMGHRDAVRALRVRAMFRLNAGKLDEAWEDLLTSNRLPRLVGQGPILIDALVAIVVDGIACGGDLAMLQHVQLTPPQIGKMRDDLAKLPRMPAMADKMDAAERLFMLDGISTMMQEGLSSIARLDGDFHVKKTLFVSVIDTLLTPIIDWDLIHRMSNMHQNRVVDAYRKPTRAKRIEAINKIHKDLAEATRITTDRTLLATRLFAQPRKTASEWYGYKILKACLGDVLACSNAEDRSAMQFELTQLAFALAAYRADHGSYPAKLAELKPKYVAAVPQDVFTAAELRYKPEGKGYLLYSLGVNGKDDGGRGTEDCDFLAGEDFDDIIVRMPAKAP